MDPWILDFLFWLIQQNIAVSYWTLNVTVLRVKMHSSEDYCKYSFPFMFLE